jgi:hypothetical protein
LENDAGTRLVGFAADNRIKVDFDHSSSHTLPGICFGSSESTEEKAEEEASAVS